MEATLARTAAARAIRDSDKPRLGGRTASRDEPKPRVRPWALSAVLLLVLASWLGVRDSNRVEGWAVVGDRPLASSTFSFVSRDGREYRCHTNSVGDFVTALPSGAYSVFRMEGEKKIKSPSVIRCESAGKFRIFFAR